MSGILYLSYTGMLEPLGQSQVLAYLERLAADRPIHLVSFETAESWEEAARRGALSQRIASAGIVWHPMRYHKKPYSVATAYDIAGGIALGVRLVRRHGLPIVHARSYVPSVMALAIKRLTGARYLFDMRGFWADERVDGGLWPRDGRLYRIAKGFERRFLLSADAVVSLTHTGKREIESFPYLAGSMPPITVIPTCADLERFTPGAGSSDGSFTLGYVGGAGTWYLFDEALATFSALKRERPNARLLIVNRNEHAFIRERLLANAVPSEAVELLAADHSEIPALMRQMDAGIVLIKPVYSKAASAPTKLAEFLGCGVPCLVNSGVGDMESVVADHRAGIVMRGFSDDDCRAAVCALVDLVAEPNVSSRCVETARRHFALDAGVRSYRDVYDALSAQRA